MEYLCLGCTNQEIAKYLGIAVNTVKTHVSVLYRALDASNRVEAVARYRTLFPQNSSTDIGPSVTALPFVSAAKGNLELGGLVESISCWISRSGRFAVHSILRNTKNPDDFSLESDIANAQTTFAIAGSVKRSATGAVIWVQIIEVPLRRVCWIQAFPLDPTNPEWVLRTSTHIANVCLNELLRAEYERTKGTAMSELLPIERALQGFHLLNVRTKDNIVAARALFTSAVEQGPELAMAHYGLALVGFMFLVERYATNLGETRAAIERHAKRCAALAPFHHDSNVALSLVRLLDGRLADALQLANEAVQFNPCSVLAHNLLGQFYAIQGRLEKAHACIVESARLSEYSPSYSNDQAALAMVQFAMGDYADAAESCRMALRHDFEHRNALVLRVVACFLAGETAEIEHLKERIYQLKPRFRVTEMAILLRHAPAQTCERFLSTLRQVGIAHDEVVTASE